MSNILKAITNQEVMGVSFFKSSFQLLFENGSKLTIYHPISLEKGQDLREIIGVKLDKIEEYKEKIVISFQNLKVNVIKNWEYGPEIMQLNSTEYPIVIWKAD